MQKQVLPESSAAVSCPGTPEAAWPPPKTKDGFVYAPAGSGSQLPASAAAAEQGGWQRPLSAGLARQEPRWQRSQVKAARERTAAGTL
jgi:hypothetical protein